MQHKIKNAPLKIAALALSLFSIQAVADISVIVHPGNAVYLNKDDVARLFLGKQHSFKDGSVAVPVDQNEGSEIRDQFYVELVNKNASQLKSWWARLIFTGKGSPPRAVGTNDNVVLLVGSNPNMIGYVDSEKVDKSVRVVLTLD
ncbi:phosphate ABC transporter substrate-binding protein [Pelagibaculum spongiae]|uniref:Phosphate ABC transporter substrate-binding protein n=1 Tax=Pelagibaculum spongiae TaxID=2080658 RepID=A0A2V1H500_9GAMM|nr:phosphate ABC transporter substrate-binding protein [Pelagibaculum spongiae]PVZ71482.1 phosphate ABC transporter substrate-binding protein [Pelagibaculum spongiae]